MPEDERAGKTPGRAAAGQKEKHFLRESVEAIVIALAIALLIRTFVIQAFKIPSSSMEDTLLIGDHILVNKFAYGMQVPHPAVINVLGLSVPFFETQLRPFWGEIKRGDVVVFRFPGDRTKDYIKRVIGLPGDVVEMRDKKIYVNGAPWDDPYGIYKGGIEGGRTYEDFAPYTVPKDRVFVMGDNRDRSFDSRFWGTAGISDIKGRAFIIYFSWNKENNRIRFGRIARLIR